ncbi:hypothetical protein [Rubellicoccus peritrichatus]|uniref:Uncharacterized protein n=1 Tax=Rubellicoccus peritrichatus TaxID=3080537 RepID=A0AAQ3L5K7_9BACT|nr:hypothetical protein [Puniceicoccus sp. CR14]WOO39431.1 hypothetical protein RZN69_12470 [Puniceicoccus sp. CR14]
MPSNEDMLKITFIFSLLTSLCLLTGCQQSTTTIDDGYGMKFTETSDADKVKID